MSPRNPPLTKSAGLFGEGEKPGRAAGPACQFRMLRRQNPSPGERQSPVILAVPAGRRQCAVNRKRGGSRNERAWLPVVDTFRTLVAYPPPAVIAAFQQIQPPAPA